MVAVKICGVRTNNVLATALDAGADYIGLVFFAKSPRHLALDAAAGLAAQMRGRAKSVALVVNPDDELLCQINRIVKPDILQLHGNESPRRVSEIKALLGLPILKAIAVATQTDAAKAHAYLGIADQILFDAKPVDTGNTLPGGNGIAFDWQALAGAPKAMPFMLSGGLTPDNVATAIASTGCQAVDVSSGVETAPGEKAPHLIRSFLTAAKPPSLHKF